MCIVDTDGYTLLAQWMEIHEELQPELRTQILITYGVTRSQWVKSYVHVSYVAFHKAVHVNAELKCIVCRVQYW